ncbi:MAG: SGNH/GDSL hydrolase family protein [Bacilli bacterium]|nr:SGNH/GDSL hydrolase family protein [Bacilli bacterium]
MKKIINLISFICLVSSFFIISGCTIHYNKNEEATNDSETFDFSNTTYMVFGDSITYGADYSNGYKQMNTPYDVAVKNILNLKSTTNKGISGATFTRNNLGLTCMSDVITSTNQHADIISVMGGVNDFNRNLPLGNVSDSTPTSIYGSLNVTMKYLKQQYPDSYIFYMTPYKENYSGMLWSNDNHQGYNLEDVSNAIKEVALIYDIDVLDMFEYGQFETVMNNTDCDGIHPNQDFILEKTAPQIAKFIKENYIK